MNQLKHHALLFVGGDAESKILEAKKTAENLLCAHGSQDLWNAGSHPDYFFIEPAEKSNSIKIDQVRELSAKLQQKPQHADCQVVIISPAEAMTRGAANALLKTLEEPSGKVLLILISEQPQRLLPTIRSRCQVKRFAFIDSQKDDPEFQEAYETLYKQLGDLRRKNIDAITVSTQLAKTDLKITLNAVYRVIGDIAKKQEAQKQQKLFRYLDHVVVAKRNVDTNIAVNSQLLLENLFLKWSEL